MEYVELGSLNKSANREGFAESDIKEITVQILQGLSIMHKHKFAHRDIKPQVSDSTVFVDLNVMCQIKQNILLASRFPVRIKICDFGISRPLTNDTSYTDTGQRTQEYAAPEVYGFDSKKKEDRNRPAVDLWALGCVIYELIVGQCLFKGQEDVRAFYEDPSDGLKKAQKKLQNRISKEGAQLLGKLLKVPYEERPTATDALKHAWLSQKVHHLMTVQALPLQFAQRIYRASVPGQVDELVRTTGDLSKPVDSRAVEALDKWWRLAGSQVLYIVCQDASDTGSRIGLASLESAPNYVVAYFGNRRKAPDGRDALTDLTCSLIRQLEQHLDTDSDRHDYNYLPKFAEVLAGIRQKIEKLPAEERLLFILDGLQYLVRDLDDVGRRDFESLIGILTNNDSPQTITVKVLLTTPGENLLLRRIIPLKHRVNIDNKTIVPKPLWSELRRIYRRV